MVASHQRRQRRRAGSCDFPTQLQILIKEITGARNFNSANKFPPPNSGFFTPPILLLATIFRQKTFGTHCPRSCIDATERRRRWHSILRRVQTDVTELN